MIAWREKANAFAIHLLVTAIPCAGAAALVFLVWFPEPFHKMLNGTRVFEVLVVCELGLALTSLIMYSSSKSRRALLFDYTFVGIAQLAALIYGLHAAANTRPAYIVFVVDHIEVVSAGEIEDADLAQAGDRYRQRPRWGPQLVGIERPQDPKQRQKVLFSSVLAGKDYPLLPAYYVAYEQVLQQIREQSLPVSELEKLHPEAQPLVASAAAQLQIPVEQLVWLPVKHRSGFWTVLLDRDSAHPVSWLPVDPY